MNPIDWLVMKWRGDGGGQVTLKNKFRAEVDLAGFVVVALIELQKRSKADLDGVFNEASSLIGNTEPSKEAMADFLVKIFIPADTENTNKKTFQTWEASKLAEFYRHALNTVISASRRHPSYGWQLVSPVDYLDLGDWRRMVLRKHKKATTKS